MALTKVKSGMRTLATDEVVADNIAAGAVGASEIADGAVVEGELGADAVTNTKIADGAVSASQIATTFDISSKTVTLPAAAVTAHVTAFNDNQLKEDIALVAFQAAAAGSISKYELVDQTIDAFEDATGIHAANSTNEVRDSSGKYYSGKSGNNDITAFTANGTFNVPSVVSSVNVLVVGGGGGGGENGGSGGGGGGAGGLVYKTGYTVTPSGTVSVVIGSGGGGGNQGNGAVGVDSTFGTLTAKGGGGGGVHNGNNGNTGGTGGSGGGGGWQNGGGGTGNQTSQAGDSGTYGFGTNGAGTSSPSGYGGGAGGGAGAAGSSWTGGAGKDYSSVFGTSYGVSGWFAGGGGGAATGGGGAGGQGGGGAGASGAGTVGTVNTGGGGGGGSNGGGAAGGSGMVLVQNVLAYENLTLVSNSTTAQSAPTKGDLVFTYTNEAGTSVLGTNITAEFSADNGSTWTDFGIGASDAQGTIGGHTIVTKHDVALTSTSGTTMVYRIKTLVQSAALATRIHAVSLGWS